MDSTIDEVTKLYDKPQAISSNDDVKKIFNADNAIISNLCKDKKAFDELFKISSTSWILISSFGIKKIVYLNARKNCEDFEQAMILLKRIHQNKLGIYLY